MKIAIDDLEFKFQVKNGSQETLATMTLVIGQFEIRGFRIMRTQFPEGGEEFVLFPPANRSKSGPWVKVFWTDSKDDWAGLQERALAKFREEQAKALPA